jgi:hypothetical protein
LNHSSFHLLGGELAGSKREKERKREEQKIKEKRRKERKVKLKKSDEDKDRRGRRGTIHHNGIMSHVNARNGAYSLDILELNFAGYPKLVQNPTANKPPRRRLCAGHMCKDGPQVFRARDSNKVYSLLLVFWTMQQDMADSLCMPTAVTT